MSSSNGKDLVQSYLSQADKASKSVGFSKQERVEYVLLVAKSSRTELGDLSVFKPTGTEWATQEDLIRAGYVPREWWEQAMAQVSKSRRAEALAGIPEELHPALSERPDVNEFGYVES